MGQDASSWRTAAHDRPPKLPEFDVYQDADGRWHGDHFSGRHVDAASFERLERRAIATRFLATLRRAERDG